MSPGYLSYLLQYLTVKTASPNNAIMTADRVPGDDGAGVGV